LLENRHKKNIFRTIFHNSHAKFLKNTIFTSFSIFVEVNKKMMIIYVLWNLVLKFWIHWWHTIFVILKELNQRKSELDIVWVMNKYIADKEINIFPF